MDYDKPFKNYDELMELMISRNIEIADRTFARNALDNISYYTLVNGYKDTFLSLDGKDMFIPGTKFEELYTIHILDTNLNAMLLKYILHIERSLKSKISYIVSQNHGVYTDVTDKNNTNPNDYLFLKNYSSSNNRRKNILRKIKQCSIDSKNNLSLTHYKETKNHIPPWILIGNIPLGLTIQWYCILKNDEKSYVCERMISSNTIDLEAKKELFLKALNILKDYRNSMAHGIRTFNSITSNELPKQPLLSIAPSLIQSEEYLAGIGKNDLFSLIIIICLLINDRYLHTSFLFDLQTVFHMYLEKDIRFCGKNALEVFRIPEDIFSRLFNYIAASSQI